jgi:hypothetical protein
MPQAGQAVDVGWSFVTCLMTIVTGMTAMTVTLTAPHTRKCRHKRHGRRPRHISPILHFSKQRQTARLLCAKREIWQYTKKIGKKSLSNG